MDLIMLLSREQQSPGSLEGMFAIRVDHHCKKARLSGPDGREDRAPQLPLFLAP
jgi:hypothetical protein